MDEVDGLAVDRRGELGKAIEARLLLAPVEPAPPVLGQPTEVGEGNPAAPAHVGELVGPACLRQPVTQVGDVGLRDVDGEGSDVGVKYGAILVPNSV